ncbi:MAG TPA: hypothetical protein VFA18_02095 [Gemmataceae bacterium]|nr:hypothetical protein [Gemmataceae bacterium]
MRAFAFTIVASLLLSAFARADAFERYTNPVLRQAPGAPGVKQLARLTPELLADNDRVVPGASGALVIVRTNGGLYAKLIMEPIRQKIGAKVVSAVLIDRYVTYKAGEEQAIEARGQNVELFAGFRQNLDIGQVVPADLGGDLRYVVGGGKSYVEPLGQAKLYLVTRPLPGTERPKRGKLEIGATFEPAYFNGVYQLHADGRRSGKLVLRVGKNGAVSGVFYSAKDGRKYEVHGTVGSPNYSIQFTVQYPRTEETFQGYMFTGDGAALAGTSQMNGRAAGFYALRTTE